MPSPIVTCLSDRIFAFVARDLTANTSLTSMSGLFTNHGVSNNQGHRAVSDKLDDAYFKDHPTQRAVVHAAYHAAAGAAKAVCGNFDGAQAEMARAGQQMSGARPRSPGK